MKYLISSVAVAFLLATGAPAFAADPATPAPAASVTKAPKETHHIKTHHAKTHGAGMMHHHEGKKMHMGKKGKAASPDHSADSLNAQELQKLQAGK